ncbi:MAG: glycosyltransferase family 4 protein [Steroidobacter sp.]
MKVTIIQQVVPHYRVAFFRKLHEQLSARQIAMQLLYGTIARGPADAGQLLDDDWAKNVYTWKTRVLGINIVWQSVLSHLKESDLVVIEQSNRLLVNYLLLLRRPFSRTKLAYWGHGRNMQSTRPRGMRESIKRLLLRNADWWFAYTSMTHDYLLSRGYPETNITLVNNAVENRLAEDLRLLSLRDRATILAELGLPEGRYALFCGGLYQQKRIDFLLQAATLIRQRLPDFELLVVGDGPDRCLIQQAMKQHTWIHYAGHVVGESVARYWHVSKLLLMPGLVGLAIVDSFNAACPMVTTDFPYHSPEIAYLDSGVNGLMTENTVESFAAGVLELFGNEEQLNILRRGCINSAAVYTVEKMVQNFAEGIEHCLRTEMSASDAHEVAG